MNCMKCGRETLGENAFCPGCLLEMEKYPVRPGTVVLLPRRKETSVIKKVSKRHVPTAEEQILFLRKCVIILTILFVLSLTAVIFMFNPTMHYVLDKHHEIGQNYSTVMPAVTSQATNVIG